MNMRQDLTSLKQRIWTILYLFEKENGTIAEHIDSVLIESGGYQEVFPILKESNEFSRIVATLSFFKAHIIDGRIDITHKQCKREVLKCTHLLDLIIVDMGGE